MKVKQISAADNIHLDTIEKQRKTEYCESDKHQSRPGRLVALPRMKSQVNGSIGGQKPSPSPTPKKAKCRDMVCSVAKRVILVWNP